MNLPGRPKGESFKRQGEGSAVRAPGLPSGGSPGAQREGSPAGTPELEAALCKVAPLPRDDAGPLFAAPWQAQAFALAVYLHARGLFTWTQWAEALAAEIRAAGDGDDGSRYYEHWLAALEKLVAARGAADAGALHELAAAWMRAAAATPHGKPIELANDPLARR